MAEIQDQILSFGEIQEAHSCVTIAYSGVRIESEKLYDGVLPTEAYQQCIIYLQEQAKELEADGIKNINIKMVTLHDKNGKEVIDFVAHGTIIKLNNFA